MRFVGAARTVTGVLVYFSGNVSTPIVGIARQHVTAFHLTGRSFQGSVIEVRVAGVSTLLAVHSKNMAKISMTPLVPGVSFDF